jgi:hypothetical protein
LRRRRHIRRILQFLATEGAFLYEAYNCRIVDSEYIPTFGGTGNVTLRNEVVELRLWLERDRLFMDLRAVGTKSKNSWFSTDIVRQLLTGEVNDKSLMDQENAEFLKENFEDVQERFSNPRLSASESACRELESQRSKRQFG